LSLKFLELIYDYSADKWVWLDIRADAIYVDNIKKKAPKRLSRGFYSMDWNFVFGRRGGTVQCAYCGLFISAKEVTRDHVYPRSKGGYSTAPACRPCNEAKIDLRPIEWAVYAYKYRMDIR
jgi:5-methylcytosine-specific restriction endonuclease McrA